MFCFLFKQKITEFPFQRNFRSCRPLKFDQPQVEKQKVTNLQDVTRFSCSPFQMIIILTKLKFQTFTLFQKQAACREKGCFLPNCYQPNTSNKFYTENLRLEQQQMQGTINGTTNEQAYACKSCGSKFFTLKLI